MSVARGKATDFSCVTTKNMTMKGANFLEKLLDNQPVEWKKLGEVAEIGTGKSNRQDEVEEGEYPFYVRSKKVLRSSTYQFDETAIVIPGEGGIGDIFHYVVGKYALHQRAYRIKLFSEQQVLPKFLFHFMTSAFKRFILSRSVGATATSIRKPMIEEFPIPIPPLSVQERIVEILDKFTSLEAELEAELDCRKRQYIYYRELLLLKNPLCLSVPLGQLGEVRMCKRILKNQTTEVGDIPFYKIGTFGKQADAFISRPLYEEFRSKYSYPSKGDMLISASGTIGRVIEFDGEDAYFQDSNIVWLEHDGTKVLNRYLYHCYQIADWKVAKGGTITRLYNDNFKKTEIPIPSLSEQARIVEILDKFDTLTNSISEGLPLEIQLRKQQYEYYREQLLDFRRF